MKKSLGIIGGMGAHAGARFVGYLLDGCRDIGIAEDSKFPKFTLYNIPIQGMDERGIVDAKGVFRQLRIAVGQLESFGCDLILMACNTVHCFHHQLQGRYSGTLVDMIEFASHEAAKHKCVGVICSETTKKHALYQNKLASLGVRVIDTVPDEQEVINRAIKAVIGGCNNGKHENDFHWVCANLKNRGAEAILVGCTELPVVLNQKLIDIPLIDAGQVTVKAALSML